MQHLRSLILTLCLCAGCAHGPAGPYARNFVFDPNATTLDAEQLRALDQMAEDVSAPFYRKAAVCVSAIRASSARSEAEADQINHRIKFVMLGLVYKGVKADRIIRGVKIAPHADRPGQEQLQARVVDVFLAPAESQPEDCTR